MKHDSIADMFSVIKNSESIGKKECITPASNLIKNTLKIMQKHGYIGSFEFIDDGKSGKFRVSLVGRINDCNVIKPRFSMTVSEIIDWEKKYLPSLKVGILILSTSKGVMDHKEARKDNIGGKLVGFVY